MENERERGPVSFPPPSIYVAGLLLGWIVERFASTPNLPKVAAWITLGLGLVSFVALDGKASTLFARRKTGIVPWAPATTLVTDGPYRFTRNPMYLGMALLYLGLALGFGLLWAVALLPVIVVIVDRVVIGREEAYLEAKFGDEYRAYKERVRRWI
jgi:protein-S-isoprenylcysteine O-methyltransferase Ste14